MTAHRQSLRPWLAALEASGRLLRIDQPVSRDFDMAACLAADETRAQWFSRVEGAAMPVVGNLLVSRDWMAEGIGCPVAELQERLVAAIARPTPPVVVAAASCQDEAIDAPDLEACLPIPRFFEGEARRYVTAGCIVARDRVSGATNLSIARVTPLGGNRAMIGIAPNHHLAILGRAAAARGEELDIAVTVGNHAAVLLASCLYLRLGDDEMACAGTLLGEPVEVAETRAGLRVPAHCELVLEGRLHAGETVDEGPVSEFHGMYEDYGPGTVATFDRLTRRRDAVFQAILPGHHREHCLLGGVAIAAGLVPAARQAVPGVRDIAVGLGGCGRLHAVVSLAEHRPGDPRKLMFALWAAVNLIKQVVVVDDDIDPWDPVQVEWALATRMRADEDIVVVPRARTDRSEPVKQDATVANWGIDATRSPHKRADWCRARPPAEALARARALLRQA